MLGVEDIRANMRRVTYKPGWTFEVVEDRLRLEGPHLRIICKLEDAYHPGTMTDLGIDSPIPPVETPQQLFEWLMWRLARIETHEVREWLLIDGERRFDPHDGVER